MTETSLSSPLSPSRERSMLLLLALAQFAVIFDVISVMPLAPQLMSAFGAGPSALSGLIAAYSWCACASGLIAAAYADRFDRKTLLLSMFVLFFLGNIACALSASFPALMAARALCGFSGGVVSGVVMAIVGDAIPASRRGAAISVALTASSLASIFGVPLAVGMASRFGWESHFLLLAGLSLAVCLGAWKIVPSMASHIGPKTTLRATLSQLGAVFANPRHRQAFALSMGSSISIMLLAPFIAPVLAGNLGFSSADIGWAYFFGGCSALITSRFVGRWCDRSGSLQAYSKLSLLFIAPALFLTHLPQLSLAAMACFFTLLTSTMSGRSISLQSTLSSVSSAQSRGSFLSANLALQQLASGAGAWLGSLTLSMDSSGRIEGYGANGWAASAICIWTAWWVFKLRPSAHHGEASDCAPIRQAPSKADV